eukprot:EG_transcript_5606
MPLSLPDGLVVYTTWIGALRKEQSDCKRLRLLFDMLKLQYIDIDVGFIPCLRKKLSTVSGTTSLPQVFVANTFIGDYEAVQDLHDDGRLLPQLAVAGYREVPNFRKMHIFDGEEVYMGENDEDMDEDEEEEDLEFEESEVDDLEGEELPAGQPEPEEEEEEEEEELGREETMAVEREPSSSTTTFRSVTTVMDDSTNGALAMDASLAPTSFSECTFGSPGSALSPQASQQSPPRHPVITLPVLRLRDLGLGDSLGPRASSSYVLPRTNTSRSRRMGLTARRRRRSVSRVLPLGVSLVDKPAEKGRGWALEVGAVNSVGLFALANARAGDVLCYWNDTRLATTLDLAGCYGDWQDQGGPLSLAFQRTVRLSLPNGSHVRFGLSVTEVDTPPWCADLGLYWQAQAAILEARPQPSPKTPSKDKWPLWRRLSSEGRFFNSRKRSPTSVRSPTSQESPDLKHRPHHDGGGRARPNVATMATSPPASPTSQPTAAEPASAPPAPAKPGPLRALMDFGSPRRWAKPAATPEDGTGPPPPPEVAGPRVVVQVKAVAPSSICAAAGLEVDDVLVEWDSHPVPTVAEFAAVSGTLATGHPTALTIRRSVALDFGSGAGALSPRYSMYRPTTARLPPNTARN